MKITIPTPKITINIPDDVTGLQRKATFETLIYNQKDGAQTVASSWLIEYYKDGEKVTSAGINAFSRQQIADLSTYVNASTGETFVPEFDTEKNCTNDEGINWVSAYEFYYTMAENTAIKLHDVIKAQGIKYFENN